MTYDVIVAGGGMAGLTAAAYLSRAGRRVLLCEKEDRLGGLVGSFKHNGYLFDAGIRAMENSGVLFPMLRQLGLDIPFVKSGVTIGVGDARVSLDSKESILAYQEMLADQFPEDREALDAFIALVKKAMGFMDILYGIDNPLFLDNMKDPEYMRKELMPWMIRYIANVGKIKRFNMPVSECLEPVMSNKALIDVLAQHFFKQTPAFFALSYFSLYLDYCYPTGGTGKLVDAMEAYIRDHGGDIRVSTEIRAVSPAESTVEDAQGNTYGYRRLVWCADQKALYASLKRLELLPERTRQTLLDRRDFLRDKEGGDSVLTLYLEVDLDKEYFAARHGPHFFYTPSKLGLGAVTTQIGDANSGYSADREAVFDYLRAYLKLTTYEISIPALRDESLAPAGKTGLIISTLMDYPLVSHIREQGWYDAFKTLCQAEISAVLTAGAYPELSGKIEDGFVSTPLTLMQRTGNTGGAITGWAFTNSRMPAVSSMPAIAKSVRTPIPGVLQAGQWSFSPSGLPVSILTGKLAADRALKELRR